MSAWKRTVLVMGIAALVAALLSGCTMKKIIVPVDGDGMINTAGPLLDAIAGRWSSADGRMTLFVDGYDMSFMLDGENVLSDGCDFAFDGTDTNIHTDFSLYCTSLTHEDKTEFGTVEEIYYENAAFTVTLGYSDGGTETFTLEKE